MHYRYGTQAAKDGSCTRAGSVRGASGPSPSPSCIFLLLRVAPSSTVPTDKGSDTGLKPGSRCRWPPPESRHGPARAPPALPLTAALSPSPAAAGGPAPPCRSLPLRAVPTCRAPAPARRPPRCAPAAASCSAGKGRFLGGAGGAGLGAGAGAGPAGRPPQPPRGTPRRSAGRTRAPLPALLAGAAAPPCASRLGTRHLCARGV